MFLFPEQFLVGVLNALVSQLVSHPVWDAASASLVLSFSCLRSCLPACLPSGLSGLVFLLSLVLSPSLSPSPICCVRLSGLVFLLSAVLSPSLSPILSNALSASVVLSFSCFLACLSSWLGCCVRPLWSRLRSCLRASLRFLYLYKCVPD